MVRGLLMLLVVAGHVLEQEAPGGLVRWLVYGFHMPLFLALSGYLLNLPAVRARRWRAIAGDYGGRLLLPWLIAMMVYLAPGWRELTAARLPDLILHPPFHLWYVPVLLAYVLLARLAPFGRTTLCLLAVAATGWALAQFQIGQTRAALAWLPDLRLFFYALFFFAGVWTARQRGWRPPALATAALTAIGMTLWLRGHGRSEQSIDVAAFLSMNLGLIGLLPWMLARARLLPVPSISAIGRQSLFFYLWHPLVIAWLQIAGLSGALLFGATVALLFLACRLLASLPLLRRVAGLQPATA